MRKRFLKVSVYALILIFLMSGFAFAAPKYVFYLIGDGMGASQRQAAEYYLQAKTGDKTKKLVMNQFPIAGVNTTHSANSLVTDSAAAGTALATGYKTNSGIIAELPDGRKLTSIIELAEQHNIATGLITTTRLTHATPAVFAAHNYDRNDENAIAADYLNSGVDFFAGGGYRHFIGQNSKVGKSKRKDERDLTKEFASQGYQTFIGEQSTKDFNNLTAQGKEKVFAAFTYSHMPYELDRRSGVPSLAEMTAKGIEVLSQYENGFFLMVEGGRIDHACHANDPAGAIHDTLAFDDSVKLAYEFYQKHPDQTLIVVAADHETGGYGLGFGKNYFLKFSNLFNVKVTTADDLNYGKGKYNGDKAKFYQYIAKNLDLKDLTTAEKTKLEAAMAIDDQAAADEAVQGIYGGYDPVAIAATHILSERANMYWTTYAHTGTAVPLSAIGVGAENFGGFKDNTEIGQAMFKVMGYQVAFEQELRKLKLAAN